MLYLTQQGVSHLAERAGLKIIRRKIFEFGLNQIVLMEKPGKIINWSTAPGTPGSSCSVHPVPRSARSDQIS